MKQEICNLLQQSLQSLFEKQIITQNVTSVNLQTTKNSMHGHFASNIALQLSQNSNLSAKELALKIKQHIPESKHIEKITIAGPGFINFYLKSTNYTQLIKNILTQNQHLGKNIIQNPKKIHLEYVSANPTGPLHVGHGRSAVFGSVIATLLKHIGHNVYSEYYVNDAGRQMNILATSIWLRYLELQGLCFTFPSNGYKGDYIKTIAQEILIKYQDKMLVPIDKLLHNLPADETTPGHGNKEAHIDALITKAKTLLGKNYTIIASLGIKSILADIKQDLEEFGVTFDNWFSEKKLVESKILAFNIERLKQRDTTYLKDNALWFKTTTFGDDKDRVLIRSNGIPTYFASDVAYHCNKLDSGADIIIDILGADHHGYIARLKATLQASGHNPNALKVLLVQFATLIRNKQKIQMSTRSGEFITLRELREEIGSNATRFFLYSKKS